MDLDVDLPNRSSISISYHEKINKFLLKELISGVRRNKICEIYFYTNIKKPLELLLSSNQFLGKAFAFKENGTKKNFPFYFVGSEKKNKIGNNDVIFSESNLVEPISKVIALGMEVPKVNKKDVEGGLLSMQFTVILKHIG